MKKQPSTDFDLLSNHVINLFPEQRTGTKKVSDNLQQKEINSLKDTLGSERFFFIVDLTTFTMKTSYGVERWLGYSDKNFTLKKYWSIVHPGRQKALMMVAMQLYGALCTGRFQLNFMVQRFAALVPLKHYNGHYVLAKKTASIFQFDEQNRLTEYLDEFTIIGPYDGEPMLPVFFTSAGDKEHRGNEILLEVIEKFMGMRIFSVQELQFARKIAYNPDITLPKIAADLDLSVHTVNTYCKRFLAKARDFFHHEFETAKVAAIFLRKEGLL